jgi:guanosine-3',5'-bis(diphosphate) 3'-pyrophosphohydrolase
MPDSCAIALLRALHFAADKHRDQRRKGAEASPYINHPIEVAELLARVGGVTDTVLLQAAILHDTLEDTQTTRAELVGHFGPAVLRIVEEVTDDKSLPKADRKRLQIEHTSVLSEEAKMLKVADKISNVRGVTEMPPRDWPADRCSEYLDWTERVVAGCRGSNQTLEEYYDGVLARGRDTIASRMA